MIPRDVIRAFRRDVIELKPKAVVVLEKVYAYSMLDCSLVPLVVV